MTALTATVDNDLAAVLLQVTAAPAGPVTIERTDRNGVAAVRLMDGEEPISGAMTVRDWEPALTGTVTYTVTDAAAGTATATVTTAVALPVLMAAVLPHSRATLAAVTDFSDESEMGGTVHQVIGRAEPLVIGAGHTLATGSLTVYAGSFEDAQAVAAVARAGNVLLLRQPTYAGMDRYLTARRASVRPRNDDTTPRRWDVELAYLEQASPDGPLESAAGWNYAAHTALGLTYAQSTAQFATYRDRVIGP